VITVVTYWAILYAHPFVEGSCTYMQVLPYWLLALELCMHGAAMLSLSVRAVASLEISPDGRFWMIERSLTSSPFQKGAPLESYALWWTRVVAEGSTDDCQGCEVGTSLHKKPCCPDRFACVMLMYPVVG
jgi:hypothetical protein